MDKIDNTKRISVIGSCVCRDLFEKAPDEFSFFTDIRFSSPISLIAKPVSFVKAEFNNFIKDVKSVNGNWYKKNLINDINKTAFEALKEKHGDYLVLDFAESRISLAVVSWKDKSDKLLVTNSVSFREHYKENLTKNIFKNTNLSIINPLDYSDDFWKKTIVKFANEIKTIFKEENIILIKNMPAIYYVDINGYLHPYYSSYHFDNILLCDLLLNKLNNYFLEVCPTCEVIEIPPFAIGKQNHKWGNHPFHFTDVYYEYLLKCVQNLTNKNEDNYLENIYKEYENKFKSEYDEIVKKTARRNSNVQITGIQNLLNEYEDYNHLARKQKALILFALDKKNFLNNFKQLIKQRKIK